MRETIELIFGLVGFFWLTYISGKWLYKKLSDNAESEKDFDFDKFNNQYFKK